MPRNDLNVALKGLDDLFSSEETRQEEQREQVQQIPVDELFPFKNHPFKVLDDDAMTRTVECDTKSRNVLCINTALSIWSNPTVTCTGQKPALGSSQDNMGNLPA